MQLSITVTPLDIIQQGIHLVTNSCIHLCACVHVGVVERIYVRLFIYSHLSERNEPAVHDVVSFEQQETYQ